MNPCQNAAAGNRDKCLKTLERVKGIEPSYSAWKSAISLGFSKARSDKSRLIRPPDSKSVFAVVGTRPTAFEAAAGRARP